MSVRNVLYDRGWLKVRHLHRPVISVGNLTLGGTGKTPMVICLARKLMARGLKVCVLSRGYGGTLSATGGMVSDGVRLLASPSEAGDEPYLMASTVPGLMVVVGADRHAAGLMALERLQPDLFILDDGFQHRRLARDLDIVLLDAERPYGNGRVFPAGLLREPLSSLSRAQLVIASRWREGIPLPQLPLPVCAASHLPGPVTPLGGGPASLLKEYQGAKVAAFAGIAHPAAFFSMLGKEGIELQGTLTFPDHVPYGSTEITALRRLEEETGAEVLLTTAKDAVKLAAQTHGLRNVGIVSLEMQLHHPEVLEQLLEPIVIAAAQGGTPA